MAGGGIRIGVDIGGTFTDIVLLGPGGELYSKKILSTPRDYSLAIEQGVGELMAETGITGAQIGELVHGTTVATNAVLERKGARVGLITTRGFRDLLEMGTEQRYDIYDLFLQYPDPLVARRRRLEITERLDRDGLVVTELDLDEVGVTDDAAVTRRRVVGLDDALHGGPLRA